MPKFYLKLKNCWVFGNGCAGRGTRASSVAGPSSCATPGKAQSPWQHVPWTAQLGSSTPCHSCHFSIQVPLFQDEMHTHFCGLLIKKGLFIHLSPHQVTTERKQNRINLSLRIFLTKTSPREFPSAAEWQLGQTAGGAVSVVLHPKPKRIGLCAAEGTAEDKYIIYMGWGQGDELLQVEDRHFLSLHWSIDGFHIKHPTRWTYLQHKLLYQCCWYFLPRLN